MELKIKCCNCGNEWSAYVEPEGCIEMYEDLQNHHFRLAGSCFNKKGQMVESRLKCKCCNRWITMDLWSTKTPNPENPHL